MLELCGFNNKGTEIPTNHEWILNKCIVYILIAVRIISKVSRGVYTKKYL